MSDAINQAKHDAEYNGTNSFEAMMFEMAETVQRLALPPQLRSLSVPITVDPKAFGDEIARQLAKAFPVGKVRKLKVKRAKVEQLPEPRRFVRGWGEITLDQAAEAMRKLVDDIGKVRDQRDRADVLVAQLAQERDKLRAQRDEGEKDLVVMRTRLTAAAEADGDIARRELDRVRAFALDARAGLDHALKGTDNDEH